jgi:hypothetical protein
MLSKNILQYPFQIILLYMDEECIFGEFAYDHIDSIESIDFLVGQ